MDGYDITAHPVHLGLGATATVEPPFTGNMDWYSEYGSRHADDGVEGRLVTMSRQSKSWGIWEMHPRGSEVVLCMAGSITLHQEKANGEVATTTLGPTQYVVNDPGVWHTADVESQATVLFITAGLGTQHRPR